MADQAAYDELIPGSTPVGGQRELVAAMARQRALAASAVPGPGQAQLTPMGSKSPEQRAKEQMMLVQMLRARAAQERRGQ